MAAQPPPIEEQPTRQTSHGYTHEHTNDRPARTKHPAPRPSSTSSTSSTYNLEHSPCLVHPSATTNHQVPITTGFCIHIPSCNYHFNDVPPSIKHPTAPLLAYSVEDPPHHTHPTQWSHTPNPREGDCRPGTSRTRLSSDYGHENGSKEMSLGLHASSTCPWSHSNRKKDSRTGEIVPTSPARHTRLSIGDNPDGHIFGPQAIWARISDDRLAVPSHKDDNGVLTRTLSVHKGDPHPSVSYTRALPHRDCEGQEIIFSSSDDGLGVRWLPERRYSRTTRRPESQTDLLINNNTDYHIPRPDALYSRESQVSTRATSPHEGDSHPSNLKQAHSHHDGESDDQSYGLIMSIDLRGCTARRFSQIAYAHRRLAGRQQ
ncbi:hypothetical protein BOTBODRAFT_148374 [Botryobasidium botryosum FD-172 SS1]|uniref:Uncharacterized protein n=1 Tax=Botryobasidium botryosum (strain FD-172 SS1) TaxID=930990 RepID=A0A067LZW1_BOTB1|nr:hypothetical protein BOTBODRAFT_148374 [Botryobasidium botryosum FD-172 SS1]